MKFPAVRYFRKRTMVRWTMLLVLVFMAPEFQVPIVHAQVDTFQFDNEEQQQRFRHLSNEFRCPLCQNTNLTGSTGGVAEDLRREIHDMIMAGMSNEEIEQFMFDRYGDFILYRPRLRAETVLLWFGPLIFLLIGVYVIYRIARKANKQGSQEKSTLSEDEQKRLNELLGPR